MGLAIRIVSSSGTVALFEPSRLAIVREARGLLKTELAEAVEVTAAAIGQYENGTARPRAAVIGRLAIALSVPPQFFAGSPAAKLPEQDVHFRRLRSATKRDRTKALARLSLMSDLIGHLEHWVELPVVDIPSLVDQEPTRAASKLRAEWHVGQGPIASMTRLLEVHGVAVARLQLSAELDAFSCWIRGRPYVVLVADKADAARSRFDAAHELGHLLLHPDAHPGDQLLEREAHAFAAEFLMPAQSIRSELPARVDWRALLQLKMRWGVSMAALLRRARDTDVISESAYKRGMVAMSRYQWRRNEPGELPHQEEPSLLRRAIDLVSSETRDSQAVSRVLGWSDSLLREVAGGRTDKPVVAV